MGQNFGTTSRLDRVLEWHQLSQRVVGGLVKLLEQHKLALEATGGLARMLEQHKSALEATGGLGRMLEQHKLALEAAGELGQTITVEAGKRGGQPCIRGLRITVYDILECLASGMTVEEILSEFHDLTQEDIRACLAFAADLDGRLMSLPAQ